MQSSKGRDANWECGLQVISSAKQKIAVVMAVAAITIAAAGCIPDSTGPVGPEDQFSNAIFNELNARRRNAGLPEFSYSPRLGLDAQIWAAVMGQGRGLQHQDLNALLRNGEHNAFWTLGENILVGPWLMGPTQAVNLFMNSPPHRANILSRNFNVVGVGYYGANGQIWICLDFGGL